VPEPIEVRKVPIHSVSDASELIKLIDDGVLEANRVIAIIGKTEGNGGVNDYTRILADRSFREALISKGAPAEQVSQIPIVWSGGTDGVISPHATIFATVDPAKAEQTDEPRLTVGFAMSEPILPEEIGYVGMITKVADAVKVAMERAGITDPADVHYVQTKTPLLTIHTIRDAKSRGKSVWTEHTHESMDLSNGTTGLGIAVALGEIDMPTNADVMHNRSLYSAVASCSSGVADHDDLGLVELHARRAGGHRGVEAAVVHDVGVGGHVDLTERDGDAEAGGAVGQVHGLVGVLGPHLLASRLGVANRVDRQQRGLGLDVVNISRVGDAGPRHGDLDRVGDLGDHADITDLLGQDRLAHGEADGEPGLVGLLSLGRVYGGEDRRVRADHAVGST